MPRPIIPGEMHTYDEWQSIGYQVQRGEHSTSRDENGRALFTPSQVAPRQATPNRPRAPGEYQPPAPRRVRSREPRPTAQVTTRVIWDDTAQPSNPWALPDDIFQHIPEVRPETLQETAARLAQEEQQRRDYEQYEYTRQQADRARRIIAERQPYGFRRAAAPAPLSNAERAAREAERLRVREERYRLQSLERAEQERYYRAQLEEELAAKARYPQLPPSRLVAEYAPRGEPTGFQRFMRKVEKRPERNEDEFGDQSGGSLAQDDPRPDDGHPRFIFRR